jgi:DNA replication and repair protein RecF
VVLEALSLENFRCIQQAQLEFDPRATVVWGDNGSGKTSLLEAINFLGTGRSFRSNAREHLLARNAEFLRVVGRCRNQAAEVSLGAEYRGGTTTFRMGGRAVRSAVELAEILPLQVIDPGVHRIIEEGSARRRRLMDWGVFHVKHEFMAAWRRYHRAVEQRNAALRAGATEHEITTWDQELESAGSIVDAARRDYIAEMLPHFTATASEFLREPVELRFYSGWASEMSLRQALRAAHDRDLRVRFTTIGPHRADLRLIYGGTSAREQVSRGEQKMLSIALVLAQIRCLAAIGRRETCLLLDDPAAELDVDNLGKLLGVIARLPGQLIVTGVHLEPLRDLAFGRMFHVKQGHFHPVL